ncbi:MAG TPA: transporter substrate-binding protein [Candidatus Limnocylindria bacterium]|nr:transporter substrate-binding protein [Candidatus Limnocylindria bacterium]
MTHWESVLASARRYVIIAAVAAVCFAAWRFTTITAPQTIKIGILHSRTGFMAISEIPVINTTLMAIREINEKGGLLGLPIEPVIADGRSDLKVFAQEAERLITQEKVSAIFGCWLSSCRKAVKPVVEKYNNLLMYPVQFEGLEKSKNIIYTGASPNQQLLPGPVWMMNKFGKRLYLIGSTKNLFARAANGILKEILPQMHGEIVGEEYLDYNQTNLDETIKRIEAAKPHVIINSAYGEVNIALYKSLKRLAQKTGKPISILAYSIQDPDYPFIGIENVEGTYVIASYFDTLLNEKNHIFLQKLQHAYGTKLASEQMNSGYIGVHLWAQAVTQAQSLETEKVVAALHGITHKGAQGTVTVGWKNTMTYLPIFIAQVSKTGTSEVVWSTGFSTEPIAYPTDMFIANMLNIWPVEKWNAMVQGMYDKV